jgi:hypothetical protein
MRYLCIPIVICALAAVTPAATIDVSSQTTQVLQSGDSLAFLFTDSSYAQRAASMGLPADPSQIFFNFISAPAAGAGQFTIELESEDGSASTMFPGAVKWTSGVVETSGYYGAASVLLDSLTLSSTLSQEIFAKSEAELILTYTGPDITIGLPGNSLKHDLTVSLAGGPLSIGALDYSVTLDSAGDLAPDLASSAPEPDSAALIFGAGILLCAVSLALKRFGRSHR